MEEQWTFDDIAMMVGALYLQNYRLNRQVPKLQEQIGNLTAELETLRKEVQAKVITVTPETEAA